MQHEARHSRPWKQRGMPGNSLTMAKGPTLSAEHAQHE